MALMATSSTSRSETTHRHVPPQQCTLRHSRCRNLRAVSACSAASEVGCADRQPAGPAALDAPLALVIGTAAVAPKPTT